MNIPTLSEESDEGEITLMDSRKSTIHMGAPPPPPAPMSVSTTITVSLTVRLGELNPSTQMRNVEISPIAKVNQEEQMSEIETESPMGADELNDLEEAVLYVWVVESEEDEDEFEEELESKSMNF